MLVVITTDGQLLIFDLFKIVPTEFLPGQVYQLQLQSPFKNINYKSGGSYFWNIFRYKLII